MSENISKYLYREMDKQAGIEHTFHRTKIVATVGPSCDTYEKLLELVSAEHSEREGDEYKVVWFGCFHTLRRWASITDFETEANDRVFLQQHFGVCQQTARATVE